MKPKGFRQFGKKGDDVLQRNQIRALVEEKKPALTTTPGVVIDGNFKVVKETFFRNVFMKSEGEIIYHVAKRLLYGFVTENGDGLYSEKDAIIDFPNFAFFKGNIPVMLVAHADTVHNEIPKEIYEHKEKGYFVAREGLGADDRAGVAAILFIIYQGYKPYVLITRGEETGAHGAREAAKALKKEVEDVKCLIEMDRRGSVDAVYYDNDNKEFARWVESFGFKKDTGSFSDISVLMPAWNISGVNLSIGYYSPHTKNETLVVHEFFSTVEKVMKILDNPPEKKYDFVEDPYAGFGFGFTPGSKLSKKARKTNMKDAVFERVLNCFRSLNTVLDGTAFVTFYFDDKVPVMSMLDAKDETNIPVTELIKKISSVAYVSKKGIVKRLSDELPQTKLPDTRKCIDLLVSMSRVRGFYEDFGEYAKKNGKDVFDFDSSENLMEDVCEEVYMEEFGGTFKFTIPEFIQRELAGRNVELDDDYLVSACVELIEDFFPDYMIDVEELVVYTSDGSTFSIKRLRKAVDMSSDIEKQAKLDLFEAIDCLVEIYNRIW